MSMSGLSAIAELLVFFFKFYHMHYKALVVSHLFTSSMSGVHILVGERYIHLRPSNSLVFHVSR